MRSLFADDTLNAYEIRPGEEKPNDVFGYVVVAVIGYANDWAAYRADPTWTTDHTVRNGDKLTEKAARALFPAFDHRSYRG